MSKPCPRAWEVEAARDGRLRGDALDALQLHLQHCADCAREQAALDQLGRRLRGDASDAGGTDLDARRRRNRVLAEANQVLLQRGPGSGRGWLRPTISVGAFALCAALALWANAKRAPAPIALQLVAAPGARFVHERRPNLEYIELYDGSLDIHFDRRARLGLLVRTPDGEVHDFGTTFRVTVERGHTSEVSVREGAVLLQRRGFDDVLLRAGEEFRAPPNAEPAPAGGAADASPPLSAASDAGAAAAVRSEAPRAHASRAHSANPPGAKQPNTGLASNARAANHSARVVAEEEDRSYLHVLELLHTGRADDARSAAAAYLRAFPDGFRRLEVERISGDGHP